MTDQEIVDLYWARSEDAIAETERAYGRYIHHIAYRILRDDEDAREISNDTYLKVWNSIPPARPDPLKAFLGRIARQLAVNRLEHNTARKRGGGQAALALEELRECIPDGAGDTDFRESVVLKEALNRFLRSLPPDTRCVFLQRYWYASPVREIAKTNGMSVSAVKMTLLRTRGRLKEFLAKEGFDV